jgi:hypothetical protein
MFFWCSAGMVALFLSSWYFADLFQQGGAFLSSRTLQRF